MGQIKLNGDEIAEGTTAIADITPPPTSAPPAAPPATPVDTVSAPTPAAPPATPVSAAVTEDEPKKDEINESEIRIKTLKAIFGDDIEDENDARRLYESAKKPKELTYASEESKAFDMYKRANPNGNFASYQRITSLDTSKMDHLNALTTLASLENPDISPSDIEAAIKADYNQSEDASDSERQYGSTKLAMDGNKAKEKLREIQEKYKLPDSPQSPVDDDAKRSENINAWKPIAKKMAEEVSEIELNLGKDLEGNDRGVFKFKEITDEDRKAIREDVKAIVEYGNISTSKEDIEIIRRAATERLLVRKINDVVRAAIDHNTSVVQKQMRDKYENAGKREPEGVLPPAPPVSAADKLFNKLTAGKPLGG